MLSLEGETHLPEGRSGLVRIESGLYLADSIEVAVVAKEIIQDAGLIANFLQAQNEDPHHVYVGQLEVVDQFGFVEDDLVDPIGFDQRELLRHQKAETIRLLSSRFPEYEFLANLHIFTNKTHRPGVEYAKLPFTRLAS
jgi:hypothetical protein